MSTAVWRPQCDSHRYTGFRNDLSGEFQGPASTCVLAVQPLVNDLLCQASVNFIRENTEEKTICRVRGVCLYTHSTHACTHA